MAQIAENKHHIKLDMTPLVDLAFLLLSFFILTSTFLSSKVAELTFPAHQIGQEMKANGITLFLGKKKIYYAEGNYRTDAAKIKESKNLLRELTAFKHSFDMVHDTMFVCIIPNDSASYQMLIQATDALYLAGIGNYSIQSDQKLFDTFVLK